MTEKQRRFADAYIANGFNATQASRDAGYDFANDATHRDNGAKNLAKPYIREYIAEQTAPERRRLSMSADDIIEAFTNIATGKELANGKKPSVDNALNALDKLAKIRGMYIDKSQVELSGAVPVVISDDV